MLACLRPPSDGSAYGWHFLSGPEKPVLQDLLLALTLLGHEVAGGSGLNVAEREKPTP